MGGVINVYPTVRDEFQTLDAMVAGSSIARYGDGEFKIAFGNQCVSQEKDGRLTQELREILRSKDPSLLVGIPRLVPESPKAANWDKYRHKYPQLLSRNKTYYSAFITRPDSAPWIYTKEFYAKLESLWKDKDITLVYGTERSLHPDFPALASARSVVRVEVPRRDAYREIDAIESAVLSSNTSVAILCCGPAATCLAARVSARPLASRMVAYDLGHVGMFWYREGRHYKNGHASDKVRA